MATSFDATARISLDLRSFAQGAQAVTKAGGQMEKIFANLNQVLGKVALVETDLATKLRASLQVYSQITSATKNYATAVAALQKNEAAGANGAKLMAAAFAQLKKALGEVQGLSEKEFQRVSHTVTLYEKLAKVISTLAAAQKSMSSVTQNAITAQQKDEQAKKKSEETARKLAIEEQKLAIQRQRLSQSAATAALAEQKLALQRERLAQASARTALAEEKATAARPKLATATRTAEQSSVSFSGSSFALRNTVGELEQTFQALYKTLLKLPTAFASAAISQEAAFAQVARVVGEAEAEAAGLLQRFQEIAQNAPISFEEVARIGQLGAAIGISEKNLGDFTDTIVKFSLTTGVASEEATILLGRIAQMQDVPVSQIEQLGSAILALGTASAATDQEILRVNASIATVSNLFGLTAQETAGLSAALATLQVRPELSRGALTRVFNDLSLAVSDGGVELEKLAAVMGITGEEATKLFNNPGTRGDFLLSFIDGLSRATVQGGNVQGVLRELGINAVRDIDVFSRLANNVDIVRESFDRANVEFARGTELNRQSKGIYETTSAEIQNLSDAFKTLLATLGGPLATAIGTFASGLSEIIETISHLGPIVPIFGTLAAVIATGATAWAIYQFALAKTIQSLIAAQELQNRLKVSSLSAKLAIDIYRKGLQETEAVQAVANVSTRQLAVSTQALSAELAVSRAGMLTYGTAVATSATELSAMGLATTNAVRTQEALFATTLATQNQMQRLSANTAISALAMTNVSNANRNLALTQTQATASTRLQGGQMLIAAGETQGLNTSTVRTIPNMNLMSESMRRAAVAGVQLGAGLNGAAVAGAAAGVAVTRTATSFTLAGAAAKAAAFAMGPWGLALITTGLLLGPLLVGMDDFGSKTDSFAKSALEATGGSQALANAIKADTDAAVLAAGGLENYNKAVRDGSQAALDGIGVYRTVTTAKNDLSDADRRAAESARDEANERIRAIELTKGSVAELEKQAVGHGQGAEAARRYLREISAAKNVVKESTQVLDENTAALGENVKQWLVDTAQVVVEQSKLADGSKASQLALDRLAKSGVNVGEVLQTSLTDPQAALKTLNTALTETTGDVDAFLGASREDLLSENFQNSADASARLTTFLQALITVIETEEGAATKGAITSKLLKDALDTTGDAAASASGKIVLTKESLEDLETTGAEAQEAIDGLAENFTNFGTPLDAFSTAAKTAFGDAEDAIDKFSLGSKAGLDSYLAELDKIAKAQRDWSANLIKISATLGPDIAAQFQKLGPEAAPALAELVDLSAEELEKLGPRLSEIGSTATSDLAAAIIQNSGEIENATLQTRKIISDVFGNLIDKAKTAEDFADVSNQYSALVTQLNSLEGITVDITADDAKALKSLADINLFLDLIGKKKVSASAAIDIVEAQGDIQRLQLLVLQTEISGSLNPDGKAALVTLIFEAQLAKLTTSVAALEAEGALDIEGKGKLSDEEYRNEVLALTKFLASVEGQGLLNPEGDAQLHDEAYRAQMQALANLILGQEAAGKFDVDGDGDLDDDEFKRLLKALQDAVAAANRGKLDPKGTVTLAGVGTFNRQLGGIVQAASNAGGRITNALTRSATVSVGYYYYQKNTPPRTVQAATGGWISGPGGPKADAIPAMLSNGEYVVNAAAARRFGALLEVINRSGGRGFSGVARRLLDAGITGGSRQIGTSTNTGNTALSTGLVQQAPPESVSVFAARMAVPQQGPANVFNINNQYPQAEPTSTTINRSLAYAATVSGV